MIQVMMLINFDTEFDIKFNFMHITLRLVSWAAEELNHNVARFTIIKRLNRRLNSFTFFVS